MALDSSFNRRDARAMSVPTEPSQPLHQREPHSAMDVRPAVRAKPSVLDSPATAAVEADEEIRAMDDEALVAGIARLRREREALMLAVASR
jgi:hypothetical protein